MEIRYDDFDVADNPGDALSGIRERGKTIAQQRPVGTLEHDYHTGKETWTDEIFRICEVDPTVEPNIDFLLRHLHADDRDAIARARAMAIETGQPFEMHARIVVRSGREKKLRITGQVILEGGQPSRLLATIQDITDD